MLFVAVPLILTWLTVATFVIYSGVIDTSGHVQENLDFYTALIAIVGGPALLFINAILEQWKMEQLPESKEQGHSHDMDKMHATNGNGKHDKAGFGDVD